MAFCRGYDSALPFYEGCLEGFGTGKNLGHPLKEENKALRAELMEIFKDFYSRHVNEGDTGTCILEITVTFAVVFDSENKYVMDFMKQTAERISLKLE